MSSMMFECEVRKLFKKQDGTKEFRWERRPVSSLPSGSHSDVRCLHCHGEVRVHRRKVEHGPEDHVEHRHREDSEGCVGGVYFDGTPRRSLRPVE